MNGFSYIGGILLWLKSAFLGAVAAIAKAILNGFTKIHRFCGFIHIQKMVHFEMYMVEIQKYHVKLVGPKGRIGIINRNPNLCINLIL